MINCMASLFLSVIIKLHVNINIFFVSSSAAHYISSGFFLTISDMGRKVCETMRRHFSVEPVVMHVVGGAE